MCKCIVSEHAWTETSCILILFFHTLIADHPILLNVTGIGLARCLQSLELHALPEPIDSSSLILYSGFIRDESVNLSDHVVRDSLWAGRSPNIC